MVKLDGEINRRGHPGVRHAPVRRWPRQRPWKLLAATLTEGVVQGAVQPVRVHAGDGGDQRKIDEILDARAHHARSAVAPGVGMDLLGDLEFERQRRRPNRFDVRKREEVRAVEHLRHPSGRGVEAHVQDEVLEPPAGKVSSHVVPDGGALVELVESRGSLDREREVVAEIALLNGQQVCGRALLAPSTREVNIHRHPAPAPQPVVEGEAALEDPSVRRHGKQAGEQAIEGDRLAEAHQRHAAIAAQGGEPRLECLAEGSCRGVPHEPVPASATATRCSTLRPRP